jgi:hypothetical protein
VLIANVAGAEPVNHFQVEGHVIPYSVPAAVIIIVRDPATSAKVLDVETVVASVRVKLITFPFSIFNTVVDVDEGDCGVSE